MVSKLKTKGCEEGWLEVGWIEDGGWMEEGGLDGRWGDERMDGWMVGQMVD